MLVECVERYIIFIMKNSKRGTEDSQIRENLIEASRDFARGDVRDAIGLVAVTSVSAAGSVVALVEGHPGMAVFFGAGAVLAGLGAKSSLEQATDNVDGAMRLARNAHLDYSVDE